MSFSFLIVFRWFRNVFCIQSPNLYAVELLQCNNLFKFRFYLKKLRYLCHLRISFTIDAERWSWTSYLTRRRRVGRWHATWACRSLPSCPWCRSSRRSTAYTRRRPRAGREGLPHSRNSSYSRCRRWYQCIKVFSVILPYSVYFPFYIFTTCKCYPKCRRSDAVVLSQSHVSWVVSSLGEAGIRDLCALTWQFSMSAAVWARELVSLSSCKGDYKSHGL